MIKIPKLRLKTFLILLPFVLSVPSVLVLALERFTTSDQRFCLTCHYQMWGEDFLVNSQVHPPEVRCPECHAVEHYPVIPPKDFSAHPDRVNDNCMRCHAEMAEKEDFDGFKHNVMKITFPHRPHVQDYGAICTDCHYNVKHDKHTPTTNRPRMVACWSCHDQETTSCLKCHPKGEHLLLSLMPRHETIKASICNQCHEGYEERVQSKYEIDFKHPPHLKASMDCSVCHENVNLHGQIVKSREECLSCHHNEVKKDCVACHETQANMRQGTAVPGIEGVPDTMAEFVECNVCHSGLGDGHSRESVTGTCSGCHDEAAIQSLESTQREFEAQIEEATRLYETIPDKSQEESKAIAEALDILRKDGSRGFHNPVYVNEVFKQVDQKVTVMANAGPR